VGEKLIAFDAVTDAVK